MSGFPEIQGEYSLTFKQIIVGGLFGSIQPIGLQASVFSIQNKLDKVISTEPMSPHRTVVKRVIECELTIDPMQMKSIHKWLDDKIKEYERLFGPIPSPEEVESKARRKPDT